MKYKCIIFDCDGVLVDSEAISCGMLVDLARPHGLDISHEFAIKFFSGKSLSSVLEYIENKIEKKLPSNFQEIYREKSFAAFKKDLQPVDGIHELLNRISLPYCVASSGPVDKIKLNLTTTNLIDKFAGRIFSAYEINKWKPDPDLFLHAADQMGFHPGECVVIEDSMAGVQAAEAGNFDVFAFVNKGHENIFENTSATVFYDMNKLDALLA
jgi:HAD superfamily hydrolase (TIGR01509 family)